MTADRYDRLSAPFRTQGRVKAIHVLNRVLTLSCYVCYPGLLLWLAVMRDARFWTALIAPAVGFCGLTLFRSWVNAPRPYEALDITPLIHKDTKGHSFPSRHVFSVFVIATVWLGVVPWVGAVFLLMGVLLAAIRVIGGVHFPRDVLVGAALGVIAGLPIFLLHI